MKIIELLEQLDKMNPTDEQLALCMELRKKIFPLPLYVKLPNGDHLLTRKLEEHMTIEGIATERGIYLTAYIQPIKLRPNHETAVSDLYAAAANVHPDARPIIEDDIFGKGENTLSSLPYVDSTLGIILHVLNHGIMPSQQCFELCNYNCDCYAIPSSASPSDKHIRMYNLYGSAYNVNLQKKTPINEVTRLGLFIPAEKILTNSLKEHFADQIQGLQQNEKLFVHPPRPLEKERFPLYLYLRDLEGKYFMSNEMPVPEGAEVEGIVIGDKIFLRQTIKPRILGKTSPSIADLKALAEKIHPQALPLFFGGESERDLVTMLYLRGKEYRQTAELLLKNYGVEMPSLDGEIAYIAGGDGYIDSAADANKIATFDLNKSSDGRRLISISNIKEMIAVIKWK